MTEVVRSNTMIGLTHTADGHPVIREPKTLKVGISMPLGKGCDVFVNNDGKWVIRAASEVAGKLKWETVATVDTRKEAETAFTAAWKKAATCTYPRKAAYFNFTKPGITTDGGTVYYPDFDAIEAHSFIDPNKPGTPTEIDIIFLDNEPFEGGYQNWSAADLKCYGDGENAMRVLSMANTPEEQELAKAAAKAKSKYFPIIGGCWTKDCPYSKETAGPNGRIIPAACKPSMTIKFQLVRKPRVGGTAFFHTGSYKSISQIFSSIQRIKTMTGGRIAGIPLKMVVRSHKTSHNGQTAIQQNVSIEFREQDMDSMREALISQAWKFEQASRALEPAVIPVELDLNDDDILAGEAYIDDEVEAPLVSPAAAPTVAATQSLQERLRSEAAKPAVVAAASVTPKVQWKDRATMQHAFMKERERIGEASYDRIIQDSGIKMGELSHDSDIAAGVYLRMTNTPAQA